jgi:hypothetical protein
LPVDLGVERVYTTFYMPVTRFIGTIITYYTVSYVMSDEGAQPVTNIVGILTLTAEEAERRARPVKRALQGLGSPGARPSRPVKTLE